jgi:hypothetical protein
MIEAHIADGDYVICRSTGTAERGQMVVALNDDDEATLKYWYPERRAHPFAAANREMPPIYVRNAASTAWSSASCGTGVAAWRWPGQFNREATRARRSADIPRPPRHGKWKNRRGHACGIQNLTSVALSECAGMDSF